MNLCVNARDAMPHGGRLVVGTRNREIAPDAPDGRRGAGRGPCAAVEVRDQGTGMTPEVRARIFEPFFTTKPAGKGTGLGLAMVYGFVAQSGGTVEVDTAPGAGTSVRLLLPRAASPGEGSGGGNPVPAEFRGSETVLLVEDEPAVAEVARRALDAAGYRVVVASCGEVATRIAADGAIRPDVLLTDVVMPGLNGREVASIVAGLRPGIRVLYMSGYTDDVVGQHGVLEPGIDLIAKPFRPEALRARVREILDRGTAQRPPVRLWREDAPGATGVPG
jgi:CheY-like chemotaxis protein